MARSTTYRNAATNAVASAASANWIALHTATPNSGNAAELAGGGYARVQVTFPGASAGSSQVTAVINVPAGVTVTHWSRQTASSGAAYYEDGTLSPSAVFNSAGTLTLTLTVSTPA